MNVKSGEIGVGVRGVLAPQSLAPYPGCADVLIPTSTAQAQWLDSHPQDRGRRASA